MDAAGASGMLHTVQPECYDSPVQLEARPLRACRAGSQAASMAAEVHRTAIGCPASEASCRQWGCASRLSNCVWHQHGKLGPKASDMDHILVRRSVITRLTTQLGNKSQGYLQLLLEVWGAPLNHSDS